MTIYVPKNPKWETERTIVVRCDCSLLDHQSSFTYFTDDELPAMYIDTVLAYQDTILKRIWQSIRYIFGFRSRYATFSEIVVTQESAGLLAEFLREFSELPVNREEKR